MHLSTLASALLISTSSAALQQQHLRRSPVASPEYIPIQNAISNATMTSTTSSGFRTVGYFVNWAIYARQFNPQQVPADKLTHVNYAFADINNETGEVVLTDLNADVEKLFPGDSTSEKGTNLYGCLKQFNLLKRRNRGMKLLLSIGGSTLSKNFPGIAHNATKRAAFAKSSVDLLKNLGLDGIDIDWEYPKDLTEAQDLVELLRVIRAELNVYEQSLSFKPHFLITLAVPAGPLHYKVLDLQGMEPYVDFFNLMAYDYAGSWDTISGHMNNLYVDRNNPPATPFNSARAIKDYIDMGVPSSKLVLGMPLYGRAFSNNTGGPGTPYHGLPKGSWEAGVWDYKALPLAGAQVFFNPQLGASWSYNLESKEMVSYETVPAAQQKTQIITSLGLGGAMWWETSGDRRDNESLISTVHAALPSIEGSLNVIDYPYSKYDNLRNGFPGES